MPPRSNSSCRNPWPLCEKDRRNTSHTGSPQQTVFVLGTSKLSSYHSRYVRWNNGRTSNPQIDFRMKTNFSRGRMKCRDSNHPWAKSKTTGVILIGRWRVMDRYTSPWRSASKRIMLAFMKPCYLQISCLMTKPSDEASFTISPYNTVYSNK